MGSKHGFYRPHLGRGFPYAAVNSGAATATPPVAYISAPTAVTWVDGTNPPEFTMSIDWVAPGDVRVGDVPKIQFNGTGTIYEGTPVASVGGAISFAGVMPTLVAGDYTAVIWFDRDEGGGGEILGDHSDPSPEFTIESTALPELTLVASGQLNGGSSAYSQTGVSFGTAYASRRLILLTAGAVTNGRTLVSATIGGVTDDAHEMGAQNAAVGSCYATAIVPTGTSGDIVASMSDTTFGGTIFWLYAVDDDLLTTGVVDFVSAVVGSGTSIGPTGTLTVDAGGCYAAAVAWGSGSGKEPTTLTDSNSNVLTAAGTPDSSQRGAYVNELDGTDVTLSATWTTVSTDAAIAAVSLR